MAAEIQTEKRKKLAKRAGIPHEVQKFLTDNPAVVHEVAVCLIHGVFYTCGF